MTELYQIYRCNICGNITEVRQTGGGALVCCNQPMELLVPQTIDSGQEKHVPIVTAVDGGVKVIVGQEAHPMDATHYIQWIEYIIGPTSYFQELQPNQAPEALFIGAQTGGQARCYCNLHGHWTSLK